MFESLFFGLRRPQSKQKNGPLAKISGIILPANGCDENTKLYMVVVVVVR